MKRILIASAAFAALTGAAFAQQSPVFQGNYSSNVIQTYDRTVDNDSAGIMIGGMDSGEMRASVRSIFQADPSLQSGDLTGDLADQEDNRGR